MSPLTLIHGLCRNGTGAGPSRRISQGFAEPVNQRDSRHRLGWVREWDLWGREGEPGGTKLGEAERDVKGATQV